MENLFLKANGLDFHALAEGPEEGPLVLLLHGFPELSLSWRHQLPALGAAGYRAVAPDLRGYGRSGRQGPYDLRTLSDDVAGLVHALGRESAVIVGHDWGGGVAWGTAFYRPEVVERLVILNCPHPAVLAAEVLRSREQLRRSGYMFFFQIPFLPEYLLSRHRAEAVARALRGGSTVRSVWTPEALEPYREAFSDRASAGAALGYYRAAFRHALSNRRAALASPVAAPTLIVWGVEDRFLGRELVDPAKMKPYFRSGNVPEMAFVYGAGHFVQNEAPEEVNRALLGWLGAPDGAVGVG